MAAQTIWVMGESKQETSQTIWVFGEPMDKIGSVETAAAGAVPHGVFGNPFEGCFGGQI